MAAESATVSSPPPAESIPASDALHARVRSFAAGESSETFEQLAPAIFEHQLRNSAGYRRLVHTRAKSIATWQDIPPVPVQAFRIARVSTYPEALDVVRFLSSGTTSTTRSQHCMRTTATYEALSLAHGRHALVPEWAGKPVVVAIAQRPSKSSGSSLAHMMRHFMVEFDGRALTLDPQGVAFDPNSDERWLLDSSGVNIAGVRRAAKLARNRNQSLLLLATSWALAMLLDALDEGIIDAPKRTVIMQTGGFKGRGPELPPDELRDLVADAFRIPPEHVVSEYGMTELTSQLYEGLLPESGLAGGRPGVFFPPPWLRAVPVDPVSLEPCPPDHTGLAKFVDLGNVDSAVAIVTEDLVRSVDGGIELVGRRRGAPSRGCSLAAEMSVVGPIATAEGP